MKGVIQMKKEERISRPRVDLTGKTFTYLIPQSYIKGGKWNCKCKCGNEIIVDTRNLNSGHTKSCGCLQKEKASENTIDMSAFEDESIQVIKRAGSDDKQVALWECLCKTCGNIFVTRGKSIRAGQIRSCGCSHSLNEQIIANLLSENNIEFAREYTFPDLCGLNGGKLRFDFAILKNGKLSHLIEYNGEQHYTQPEGSWKDGFVQLQQHDILKQEYCQKHDIRLVVIRYNQEYQLLDLL